MLTQHHVRNCTTCDDRLVVAKHPQWTIEGNTKRLECVSQINHALSGFSSHHKLGTVGCSFNLTLLLTEPINGHLLNEFQNTTGGSPCNHVMHSVGISKGRQVHRLTLKRRSVCINLLLWRTIDSFHLDASDLIISKLFLAIGDPCVESNGTVQTLLHMPNHMLQSFQMSFKWCCTGTTKRHHSMSNAKSVQYDQPLSGINQQLEIFDTIRSK